MSICVSRLTLWRLELPMRMRFRHATAGRDLSEPLVVAAELSDGTIGFGETHPRPYVSGETIDGAIQTIREGFLPYLLEVRADSFPEALEAIDALPETDDQGRPLTAARAAVELALIDAFARSFRRSVDEVAGWLGLPGLGAPGSLSAIRFSGVVGGEDRDRVAASIRKMRCFGLRHFKIKVGDDGDDARVRAAVAAVGRGLKSGRASLRVDANGGWTLDQACARLEAWADLPIASVEQPLPRGLEADWHRLLARSRVPLMADESLVTAHDAERLLQHKACTAFNIRLSKNGGLLPSLRFAALARRNGLIIQVGCMVGETSILSAAGLALLRLVPGVRFAEGCYGRFLLETDVIPRPLRFGYGGHPPAVHGPGWGLKIDPATLRAHCPTGPIDLPL